MEGGKRPAVEDALWTTDADKGYAAILEGLGVMLRSDDRRTYTNRYRAFSNYRPQNLPAVKRLFGPTTYFIDATFAAPPFECHDPRHMLFAGR